MKRQTIADIISCLFIVLFVYAAATKLLDHEKFRVDLGQSPMLTPFAAWLSWLVPLSELAIAVGLVFLRSRLFSLYASLAMMVMFTTYIVIASRFSDYVPCSCGGIIQNLSWTEHLVFNGLFVVLGIVGLLLYKNDLPGVTTSKRKHGWQ